MSDTVTDLEVFLRANPTMPMDEVLDLFPSSNLWDIRHVRRTILREQAASIPESPIDLARIDRKAQNLVRSGFFRPVEISLPEPTLPLKPLWKRAGEQHLVINDLHAPETDMDALDVMVQIGQSVDLDSLTIAGDGMDCGSVSSHLPVANRPYRWIDERTEALKVLALIRAAFPETPINYLIGNHEDRIERFLASQAPQLQGLFPLRTLLGLDDLGFHFPENNRVLLADDQLMILHGTKVRGEAGQSVAAEVRDAGMSVIMGHVHRLGYVPVTKTTQTLSGLQPWFGVENGHLMTQRPSYIPTEKVANWQQGFTLVTIYPNGLIHPELIPIFNGCASFRGRMFCSRLKRKAA